MKTETNLSNKTEESMDHFQEESLVTKEVEKEKRPVGYPQLFIFIAVFYGFVFLLGIGIAIYSMAMEVEFHSLWIVGYPLLIFEAFLFLVMLTLYKRVRVFMLEAVHLSVLKQPRTYAFIALCALIFFVSQWVLIEWLQLEDATGQGENLGLDKDGGFGLEYTLFFLAIALLTPIKEELLFRGLLHRLLEKKHHFVIGLVISSVVFGVMHFDYPISATIMGLVFVFLYKWTSSLAAPMVLHILWNALAVILLTLQ